jgi:UDP-glucose:(heptosyl)LPS alpha-1,3-glucosyltransferase
MKIAVIIERADAALGGAERSVFELIDALSAAGHQVDIIAAKSSTKTKNIHVLFENHPKKRTGLTAFKKAAKNYLAKNNYDIVHSVLPFDFADVYQPRGGAYAESIIRNAASYDNKVLSLYKKTTAFLNLRRTALLRAERKLAQKPDGPVIAALSNYVAQQFKKHYGLNQQRIVVIPNGIKTNKESDTEEVTLLRSQIYETLKIQENKNHKFFLFVANNFRLKGLRPLIKAFRAVLTDKKNENCFLFAAGRDKSQKYRSLAKRLKIKQSIIFLGSVRNIQNILSISHVAILPSFYDPASRFTLEALAAAKPVITTRYNGASEMFENNRHGKIINSPEDIQQLADAISYFTNPDNIQKTSQAILEDNLKEKISINRVASELVSVYDSIIQKRRT